MNRCKPEPMGTQGYGNMFKRIQDLEDGSQQRRQETGESKDKMWRITREEYQRLLNKFEMEGFMAPRERGKNGGS